MSAKPANPANPANDSATVSPEVADFLLQVINSIQLSVAADNFEKQAALIVRAKRELSKNGDS